LEPCEDCIRNVDRNIDIIEIDAASNTGIDDIRELREKVKHLPTNSKYKIYIIDEVHMLSKGAFNALLKTLEEPPTHVIFILATTDPQKIPLTILSRVQRFNFKKMSKNTLI
ncbi:AAA family ATPase, partial [Metamycoplasma equirhinis]